MNEFCTCKNLNCPLHPTKHNKGCTQCIQKNLKLKEIPNCFFALVDHSENRNGDTFMDFAETVCKENPNQT